jgi:hypothetical protein
MPPAKRRKVVIDDTAALGKPAVSSRHLTVACPAPIIACREKQQLLMAYVAAASDLNRIHSAQLAAVLNDEGFLFQAEFAEALERKERAKYAVLTHREQHGC